MGLDEFTTDQLIKEIKDREDRQNQVKFLLDKQIALNQEVQKLSEQIKSLSHQSRSQVISYVQKITPEKFVIKQLCVGEKNLKNRIKEILAANKQPMTTKDIVAALLKSGWQTQSKDPYYPVATMLSSSSVFIRIKKGLYAIRQSA
jgi:hypothetical protein